MNAQPLAPDPAGGEPGAPSQAAPTTLEALLALKPQASAANAPAQTATVHVMPSIEPHATPAAAPTGALQTGDSPSSALDARLLFIRAGIQDSALIQTWVQRMLDDGKLHLAHLQDNVAEQIRTLQPQAVLIHFDPSATEAATALAAQLQALHPQVPRLAVGHARYPQCVLAALRAGVQDFLDVDGSLAAAQQTIQALLDRASAPAADAPSAPLTAIVSARAGVGSSLLASHLAWYLQQRLRGAEAGPSASRPDASALDTLLLDLGHPSGDCALYLNTPGEFHFMEALGHLRRFDRRMAQSALARHGSGMRLLTLPRQPEAGSDPSATDIDALLQRLRQYFRHIVADLGAGSMPRLSMQMSQRATQVWVVCEQSVASVVSTTELLRQMEAQKVERERIHLVVNRHDGQLELDAPQIARQLQLPLLAVIPERRRPLAQAVNQGRLLAAQQRREPYVQALEKLAASLLASQHPEIAPSHAAPAGQLSQLLQRFRRS